MRKMQGYDLWLFVGLNCFVIAASQSISSMEFKIDHSWDGDPRHYSIDIKLSQEGDFVIMEVDAPYFFGPSPEGGEPGKPFPALWEWEVVEAFFLGTSNMYLEVELSPHGEHLLLFLAGPKNPIKMLLPMEYNARIEGRKWHGKAKIPVGYFPPSVTLFNAYAIHGFADQREYDALYPVPGGLFENPDYHRLTFFKPIEFDSMVKRDKQLSKEWEEALKEAGIEYDEDVLNYPENVQEFRIRTDWEGEPLNHYGVNIKLYPKGTTVVMEICSPFYYGMRPKIKEGQPYIKLWKYEVVKAFFLGSSSMYLEVDFSPCH